MPREHLRSRGLSALCAQPVWGEQADRDVWVSGCPATAGEPIRVGPAWGYGTVGSLLVRGVRTVSSCGRPGRDPG